MWRSRTAGELGRLTARAAECGRRAELRERLGADLAGAARLRASAKWADSRATSIALPRRDLLDLCEKRTRVVRCGCGEIVVPVGCDQVGLCLGCRRRHFRKWRKRILRAFDSHLRGAVAAWHRSGRAGYKPGIYLITLTGPHSGSMAVDRERLGDAWRTLTKAAQAGQWWSAYALTWEATPGTKGDGHVHAHVAVLSSWIPYAELGRVWRAAVPGAVQPEIVSPKEARERARKSGARWDDAESAAYYLAKYVTKGVDPREFTAQKAAELLVGTRGKRRVTTSTYFWKPIRDREVRCKACGERHVLAVSPVSLRRVGGQHRSRGDVLAKLARRGWFVPRWGQQLVLQV